MRELFSFTGKSVIVTGGSLGIGAAAVRLFAQRGATVTIASRDPASARALVEEDGRIRHVACDVASEADVERLMEETVAATGSLDVLVNNAGIYLAGTAEETSLADWDRVMAINLTGTYLATKPPCRISRSPTGASSTSRPRPASSASAASSPTTSRRPA